MTAAVKAPELSTLMREGTREEHREAESSEFMAALLAGEVNEAGYADYLNRLAPIYTALEALADRLAADPVAAAVIDPALHRSAAIGADLAYWGTAGPGADAPSVRAYLDRLAGAATDPLRFVAHHYTRYLGDLSGGQAIGRILQRSFGLDQAGVAFYRFELIGRPKPYKDGYRSRLDALPLTEGQRQQVVDEVRVAFALNGAVFAELTEELPQYRR